MSMRAAFAAGRSAALLAAMSLAQLFAEAPDPLLIEGEPGTGKTVLARHIHLHSGLKGPFIARPIPAIPDTLQQSILFGHARGTFTGATTDQAGLVESAQGGTLFLDEIGEATAAVQASLLEVLESGTVTRLGEARARPLSVRVIAATNADLSEAVSTGAFRRDLLERFGPFRITLPPLRERLDEIVPLFNRFVAETRPDLDEGSRPVAPMVDPAVEQLLLAVRWPGNLRQLKKEARYAALMCRGGPHLRHDHLSLHLQAEGEAALTGCSLAAARRHAESRTQAMAVLAAERGDLSKVAQRLQIGERRVFQLLAMPRGEGQKASRGRPRRDK